MGTVRVKTCPERAADIFPVSTTVKWGSIWKRGSIPPSFIRQASETCRSPKLTFSSTGGNRPPSQDCILSHPLTGAGI